MWYYFTQDPEGGSGTCKGIFGTSNCTAATHPHHRTLQMDKRTTPFTGRDTIGTIVVHPWSCKHLAENYL